MFEFWHTYNTSLFADYQDEDYPEDKAYLPLVGIRGVEWPSERKHACPYCGIELVSATTCNCPGCQNPVTRSIHYLGRAVLTLYGPLPPAAIVFDPHPKTTFYVVHRCEGARRIYADDDVIMKMSNIRLVRRLIDDILVLDACDDSLRINLVVELKCDIELYPDGGSGGR